MAGRTGGFIGQDGINAPDQATDVAGTAGNASVSVSFTSPSDVGGAAITSYRVQSNDGIGVSASASPVNVTGLTNGTSYTFNVWAINPFGWSSPSDASGAVSPVAPAYALFLGGYAYNGVSDKIDKIDINSTGNATAFGSLNFPSRYYHGAFGNATRSIASGGTGSGSAVNSLFYINPVGAGGYASDFGDLTGTMNQTTGCSNSTRGLAGGGVYNGTGKSNVVNYVTIATLGNALDYGDLSAGRDSPTATASTTRAIFAGGDASTSDNIIDYRTISTTGNFSDFGDLTVARYELASASSSTRALFCGGNTSSNTIDYVTISSTGNATDFGNLTENKTQTPGAASSPTRAVINGGFNGSDTSERIDYVTISSTGNAAVFGNMVLGRRFTASASTAHGGI